jgi:tRNA pseudouridine55 synthase
MLGVVNLDKPVGPTSHDMVALLRRLTGTRRIGHAGTLDPLASGVLPILVGGATRFSEELTGGHKRYQAVIRLGIRSETDDTQGPLTAGGPLPSDDAVAPALAGFVGTWPQRPPAFSARKQDGKVAHRAARAGAPMDLPSRMVTVEAIELISLERGETWLDVEVAIRCGPGTYIRSIARDLGDRLGCGGYMASLRRTRTAGLDVSDAVTPDQLIDLAAAGRLGEAILPVAPLLPLLHLALDDAEASRFVHGSAIRVTSGGEAGPRAVFSGQTLLGTGTLHAGMLQPDKVIAPQEMA